MFPYVGSSPDLPAEGMRRRTSEDRPRDTFEIDVAPSRPSSQSSPPHAAQAAPTSRSASPNGKVGPSWAVAIWTFYRAHLAPGVPVVGACLACYGVTIGLKNYRFLDAKLTYGVVQTLRRELMANHTELLSAIRNITGEIRGNAP